MPVLARGRVCPAEGEQARRTGGGSGLAAGAGGGLKLPEGIRTLHKQTNDSLWSRLQGRAVIRVTRQVTQQAQLLGRWAW